MFSQRKRKLISTPEKNSVIFQFRLTQIQIEGKTMNRSMEKIKTIFTSNVTWRNCDTFYLIIHFLKREIHVMARLEERENEVS